MILHRGQIYRRRDPKGEGAPKAGATGAQPGGGGGSQGAKSPEAAAGPGADVRRMSFPW